MFMNPAVHERLLKRPYWILNRSALVGFHGNQLANQTTSKPAS